MRRERPTPCEGHGVPENIGAVFLVRPGLVHYERGMDLRQRSIVVTGGTGFLGSHLCEALHAHGCERVTPLGRRDFDLTDPRETDRMYAELRPEVVFHLAAAVGGIGANRDNPGRFFYENMAMGLNVVEGARKAGVRKLVVTGTVCAYPKFTPVPFRETALWEGYPEETNAPYGIAKRSLLVMLQAYRQQYGLNGVMVFPVNLYGPRDNFDLHSSHVIPAMIRKFVEAKESGRSEVVLWGDGSPTREFFYVEDCARGLLAAAERLERSEPVNLGSGHEIAIGELATRIAAMVGYEGTVRWDTSKPNGQPRRGLDVSRARDWLGFTAQVSLEEGLRRTIDWYTTHRKEIR